MFFVSRARESAADPARRGIIAMGQKDMCVFVLIVGWRAWRDEVRQAFAEEEKIRWDGTACRSQCDRGGISMQGRL